MSQTNVGITIFFPALNDEKTIGTQVAKALDLLPTLTNNFEVLVINDGSTDSTQEILEELARASNHLKIIRHPKNLGYGAALRSGFRNVNKDLIFYTDGDGQYDVEEMTRLLPLMTDACDVVNGFKMKRSDPATRKIMGAIYNWLARLLFQIPIRDVDCDFRLIRRSAIQPINLVSSSGIIGVEMIYKLERRGCSFAEAPVHHYPRVHGQSQFFTPRRVAQTAWDFLILWFRLVVFRLITDHERL